MQINQKINQPSLTQNVSAGAPANVSAGQRDGSRGAGNLEAEAAGIPPTLLGSVRNGAQRDETEPPGWRGTWVEMFL